jgi:hypothetical protein
LDVRALWLHRLATAPPHKLEVLVHGRLLPLTELLLRAAAGDQIPEGPEIGASCCQPSSLDLCCLSALDRPEDPFGGHRQGHVAFWPLLS